jgi:hypothetical protein
MFFAYAARPDFLMPADEIQRVCSIDTMIQQHTPTNDLQSRQVMIDRFVRLYNMLPDEQRHAVNIVTDARNNDNLFLINGGAGVGKSVVLEYIKLLYFLNDITVVTLAATGVAAFHVGGQTIARFYGWTRNSIEYSPVRIDEFFRIYPNTTNGKIKIKIKN